MRNAFLRYQDSMVASNKRGHNQNEKDLINGEDKTAKMEFAICIGILEIYVVNFAYIISFCSIFSGRLLICAAGYAGLNISF
mmetsp:Transcript_305/g.334  ORF Transcript_305/g.334 Transcript_305/m.334 type:complete len:82 (-) Transcript_305:308-553(-)